MGKKTNKKIYIYNEAEKAVLNADVIFSDKVISLNDKVNKKKKLKDFKKFRITQKLLSYAKKDCSFLHCLPRGNEVDEKVFLVKNPKFGNKLLIEFMFKKVFCYIVLEN